MTITQKLMQIVGERVLENEPMSKHTNFRIGGRAKWFVEVRSIDELRATRSVATENGMKFVIVGGGSNILVNDNGFDGIVIQIAMRAYEIRGTNIKAQAGVLSSALARATAAVGLKGLEWAGALPGTVGGAVRGNAGCFGGQMGDFVESVEVLRGADIVEIPKNELSFGYRDSIFKHNNDIILSVSFELQEGNAEELKMILDDVLMKRKAQQPLGASSAGCLFKNVDVSDEELAKLGTKLDIPEQMISSHRIAAGWLVEELGLKGVKIGGAQVSDLHGNFILNNGTATADNIVQLASLIKTRARDEYGIMLEEEIEYVGF
jgi:UDP-N-acetylmuramate dehydrogenase